MNIDKAVDKIGICAILVMLFCATGVVCQAQAEQAAVEKIQRAKSIAAEAMTLLDTPEAGARRSAIAKLDEASKLYLEAGEKDDAGNLLNVKGVTLDSLGDREQAIQAYSLAHKLYESIGDQSGSALGLMNIASIHDSLGEKQKALDFYARSLPGFRAAGKTFYEATTLVAIGAIYEGLGVSEKALEFYFAGIEVDRKSGDQWHEANTLGQIARVYDDLGQTKSAIKYFEQTLQIQEKIGDKKGVSSTLNNLAVLHANAGDDKKALAFYERSLEVAKPLAKSIFVLSGEAATKANIGRVYFRSGNTQKALEFFGSARAIYKSTGDREGEAAVLNNIGDLHLDTGDSQLALGAYNESLVILRRIGSKQGEANSFERLRNAWSSLQSWRLAIFYGKQAVNKYQELRLAIDGLDKKTRSTYLSRIDGAYKRLADMLVAEGRLAEAQDVLAMLKQEEIFEYIKRDASETGKLSKRADMRPEEAEALKRYNEIADKVGSLGVEFEKLNEAKNKLAENASLPAADQKRYDELSKLLEDANTTFQIFLRQLGDEFAKKPKVVADIQENSGLQADLKSWGEGVVSLYTVVGEDRYRVILTTPNVQTDGKTEIKAADLNKKIADFRTAIQDPKIDPRPLGKELYDIIVKPVEKQIDGAGAKTLLWSLDGTLRYVPIAALWDGKQFFGQKYQNVIITLASRTRLSDEPSADWRVLGLGVTTAKTLTEPNGTRSLSFSALPSVHDELSAIVKDDLLQNEGGMMSGKRLLDEAFTEQALKDRLGKGFKAVHIASHFSFRPGDMTKSFLLLGDGTALTMDKIRTSPQLKFTGVELLTLSACQTAVGEIDANGNEIESFGVIAQQSGAKAVLATLWPVADESTSLFMSEFYRMKKNDPQISKAEAIRLAQKAMIDGTIKSTGTDGGCRAELNPGTGQKPFKCDPNAPFSHPYFWSPFVLIGNWR